MLDIRNLCCKNWELSKGGINPLKDNKQMNAILGAQSKEEIANSQIGFIGFGEVVYHTLKGLQQKEGIYGMRVYSRSAKDPERAELHKKRANEVGAELTSSLSELINGSKVIISSVKGDVSLDVAAQAAEFLIPGQIYADLNNAIPSVKRKAAEIINARGAGFVDISLLELPIQVGHKALMYVSGDSAEKFKQIMDRYHMSIRVISGEAGTAAGIKALVNIFQKGVQGLYLEFAVCAKKMGIDFNLLEPLLVKPVKNLPLEKDMAFWLIRGALLAKRKAGEMKDVLQMVEDLDVYPIMLEATIQRLAWAAEFELFKYFEADMDLDGYPEIIDKIFEISREKNIEIR